MVGTQFGVRRCPCRTHHRFARLPPLSCPGGPFTLTSFAGGALVGDARLAAVCRLKPPWWTIPAILPRVSRASRFCRLGTPAAPIHSKRPPVSRLAIVGCAGLKHAKLEKIAPHGHTARLRRSVRHRSRRRGAGAGREVPSASANHRSMNRKNRPCLCEQEGGNGGGGGI
jgi:hypothetical protein